jgi:hypothetical protein
MSRDLKLKRKVNRSNLGRIIVLLLLLGILSLIFSINYESRIWTLIGLGLIFWGVFFLLAQPAASGDSGLLCNTVISAYLTIERLINEFNHKGQSYYMPPYPRDVYLPGYLKNLKDAVVFISSEEDSTMPSLEELAKGKFIAADSKGVLVTPPGLGILTQIEEEFQIDFAKIGLTELCEILPLVILRDLNLAKGMAMELNEDHVSLKIVDSLYKNLYNTRSLKSMDILGCPIGSAVACALSKTSGRSVTILKQQVSPDGSAIEVIYQITKE